MNTKSKVRAAAGVLGVLTALTMALPASAHCGGGRSHCRTRTTQCVAACTVEDCELAGRHLHDGVTYCGTHHEDGVCTAECYVSATAAVSGSYGHHSGRHHGHC